MVFTVPQTTVDMFLIWSAPPSIGGLYIIPQGNASIAMKKFKKNDPRLKEWVMFEPDVDKAFENIHGPIPY